MYKIPCIGHPQKNSWSKFNERRFQLKENKYFSFVIQVWLKIRNIGGVIWSSHIRPILGSLKVKHLYLKVPLKRWRVKESGSQLYSRSQEEQKKLSEGRNQIEESDSKNTRRPRPNYTLTGDFDIVGRESRNDQKHSSTKLSPQWRNFSRRDWHPSCEGPVH